MGLRFIKIAIVYLLIGATLGLIMGIRQDFTLAPVHAHLNLLGWATLALAGVVYHLYPAASTTRLAHLHFWIHNLALPVFMVGLGVMLSGQPSLMPVVAVGATATLIGLVIFVINVLVNAKAT